MVEFFIYGFSISKDDYRLQTIIVTYDSSFCQDLINQAYPEQVINENYHIILILCNMSSAIYLFSYQISEIQHFYVIWTMFDHTS